LRKLGISEHLTTKGDHESASAEGTYIRRRVPEPLDKFCLVSIFSHLL
jgi:hypothetical protein